MSVFRKSPQSNGSPVIISYNLKYHKAYGEIVRLANTYEPDLLCLQECFSSDVQKKASYLRIAAKTSKGKLGLAIYYRPDRFKVLETAAHPVKQSIIERYWNLKSERPRLLVVKFRDKASGNNFVVGNFHATEVTASNYTRREQIKTATSQLDDLAEGSPALLIGDFNYPFFKRGMYKLLAKNDYSVGISDGPTFKSSYFKGQIDFASATHVKSLEVTTLPFGLSDHAPISVKIEI